MQSIIDGTFKYLGYSDLSSGWHGLNIYTNCHPKSSNLFFSADVLCSILGVLKMFNFSFQVKVIGKLFE